MKRLAVEKYVEGNLLSQIAAHKRGVVNLGRYQGPHFEGLRIGNRGRFVGQECRTSGHEPGLGSAGPRGDCGVKPSPCDCVVLGASTLGTAGAAIATAIGDGTNLVIDCGDAPAFQPHYLWFAARGVGANNFTVAAGNVLLPVLLTNALVGTRPQGPRFLSSGAAGIDADAYAATREPLCVDWAPFESTANRTLTLRFYNPGTVVVQVFVVMWGQIVAKAT